MYINMLTNPAHQMAMGGSRDNEMIPQGALTLWEHNQMVVPEELYGGHNGAAEWQAPQEDLAEDPYQEWEVMATSLVQRQNTFVNWTLTQMKGLERGIQNTFQELKLHFDQQAQEVACLDQKFQLGLHTSQLTLKGQTEGGLNQLKQELQKYESYLGSQQVTTNGTLERLQEALDRLQRDPPLHIR